jgi:light-regulated signal transduction histidine kinase (bacteriophytochrome)
MFVYKRTIFELNNEFKKDMEEPNFSEKNIFKTIDTFIPIYKDIVLYVMKYYDANNDNKKNINTFYQSIKNINEILCKSKNNIQNECLHIFITLLYDKKMEIIEYFKLLDNFIKNLINKKKNNEKDIKVKMYDPETINFINNNDSNIIVNYIFDIS